MKFKGIKGLKKEDLDKLFDQDYVILSDGTRIEYDEGTVYVDDEPVLNGLPLGTIVPLAIETDDPCLQKLDGRSLLQSGIYAEFCTWLKKRVLANSSNVPTCTIEEYANEMNTYMQCGKFVINDTAETIMSGNFSVPGNSIKLPTITEFIASNNGGQQIGLAQLDQFKSHNHRQVAEATNYTVEQVGYYEGQTGNLSGNSYKANNTQGVWVTNGLHEVHTLNTGGSETRPKNIRYPYYVVVATGLKDEAKINAEGVVNSINEVKDVLSRTEQVEVIYDMTDNNKLFIGEDGFPSGIPNGTIVNKNVQEFDVLLAFGAIGGSHGHSVLVNLKTAPRTGTYFGVENYKNGDMRYMTMMVIPNAEKTTLEFVVKYFFNTWEDQFDQCYISKIIGLKFGGIV